MLAEQDRYARDLPQADLTRPLVETTAYLPAYRTYAVSKQASAGSSMSDLPFNRLGDGIRFSILSASTFSKTCSYCAKDCVFRLTIGK